MHFNRALMYTDVLKKPLVSVLQLMMGAQDSTDLDLHIAPRKIFMTGRGNIQEYKRRKAEVLGSSVARQRGSWLASYGQGRCRSAMSKSHAVKADEHAPGIGANRE